MPSIEKNANIYLFSITSRSKNALSKYSFLIKVGNREVVFCGYHNRSAQDEVSAFMESLEIVLETCFSMRIDSANVWFQSDKFDAFMKKYKGPYFFSGTKVNLRFFNIEPQPKSKKRIAAVKKIKSMHDRIHGLRKKPNRTKLSNSQSIAKVTSDASFCDSMMMGGWSYSIDDRKGVVRQHGICPELIDTSYKAEEYALKKGISEAYNMGFRDILCNCDCKGLLSDQKFIDYLKLKFPDLKFKLKWVRRNSTSEHRRCDKEASFVLNLLRNFEDIDKIKGKINSLGEI